MSRINRPLLKRDLEIAYAHSRSAAEAARYLGVSYKTFKKYATMYDMLKTNPAGKGIPRPKMKGASSLIEILEGKHPHYNKKRLRERIIRSGILPNECALCGFKEARVDGRVPITLYQKDGNLNNLKLDNLELRCYNCIFLTTGKIDHNLLMIGPQVFEKDVNELLGENINVEDIQREAISEMEPPSS